MEFIATERGVISYALRSCCFAHLSVLLSRQSPDDVTRSIFAVGVRHYLRHYLTAKLASSDLLFVERSVFKRILVNFR